MSILVEFLYNRLDVGSGSTTLIKLNPLPNQGKVFDVWPIVRLNSMQLVECAWYQEIRPPFGALYPPLSRLMYAVR